MDEEIKLTDEEKLMDEESPGWSKVLQKVCKMVEQTVRRKHFEAGLPIVYMKNGYLTYLYSDGREVIGKKIK